VLICVSLTLQSIASLSIHNQSQNINLVSPVYFIHGGKWHVTPDQEIDTNTIMRKYLEFDSGQDIPEGALVYKIQRQHAETDGPTHNEPKSIQLLAIWGSEDKKKLCLCVLPIEHDKKLNWDEDKLRQLHQKYWYLFKAQADPIESNWLLDDAKVLTATVKTVSGNNEWNIFISEETKDNFRRPLWIDAER
jgi:hypothetical protein